MPSFLHLLEGEPEPLQVVPPPPALAVLAAVLQTVSTAWAGFSFTKETSGFVYFFFVISPSFAS